MLLNFDIPGVLCKGCLSFELLLLTLGSGFEEKRHVKTV